MWIHAATGKRFIHVNDIRLYNLGPIALFSNYNLTTASGKPLIHISLAHIISLMYKLITSARVTDDLSIGFHRDRNRRQIELTNNKNIKCRFHLRIMLKYIFGFAAYQQKAIYGLGYKIKLTKNVDNAVLNKDNAINKA